MNPSSMRKGALAFIQSVRGGSSLARTSASLVPPPVSYPQESRGGGAADAIHHRLPKKRRTQQRADPEPNSSDHDIDIDIDVLVTPPPEESTPPLLLLEGDEYFVSHDGVARTYYQMEYDTSTIPLAIEEFYDLEGARKTFILRKTSPRTRVTIGTQQQQLVAEKTQGVVRLGDPVESLQIQEIESHDGIFGKAGTGATTWEASIAMSLFFSSHPHLLLGNVIELGSGVGLGGILSSFQHGTEFLDSWTLTDYNLQVLEQCKQNLKQASHASASMPSMKVCQLDWYDFARQGEASKQHLHKYDTVIACDCAYLYPDVVALSTAMEALLKRGEQSKIHLFGPYNRGALHELVRQLKEEKGLELTMEVFDMQRYRLKPLEGWDHSKYSDNSEKLSEYMRHEDESQFAAKYNARFLHVIASLPEAKKPSNNIFMSDID
jgi:predicted nicotinamide N-methyase